jgi:hypothetical protein
MFNEHTQLALFHVLVIVPIFIYVGLAREQVPDAVFYTLGGLGAVIAAYHSYRAYTKIAAGKSPWVNYIHIFLVAPLLLILAVYGKTANRKYFEMLLMLGFAAGGYHALSVIRDTISQ